MSSKRPNPIRALTSPSTQSYQQQISMSSQNSITLRPPELQTITGGRIRARSVTSNDNPSNVNSNKDGGLNNGGNNGVSTGSMMGHQSTGSNSSTKSSGISSGVIDPPIIPTQLVVEEEEEYDEESEFLDEDSTSSSRRSGSYSSSSESSSPIPSISPGLRSARSNPSFRQPQPISQPLSPSKHLSLSPKLSNFKNQLNYKSNDISLTANTSEEIDPESSSSLRSFTPPSPYLDNFRSISSSLSSSPTAPYPLVIQPPTPIPSPVPHTTFFYPKPEELILDIASTPLSAPSSLIIPSAQLISEKSSHGISSSESEEDSFILPPTPTTGSFSPSLLPSQVAPPPTPKYSLLPSIAILIGVFLCSLIFVAALTMTLPSIFIPHNLKDVAKLMGALDEYRANGVMESFHVLLVVSCLFVFKQTFSIPGSILMNILFGALYGTMNATIIICFLTAVGSLGAYELAGFCSPLVEYYMPQSLATFRNSLSLPTTPVTSTFPSSVPTAPSSLFSHLLLARFFPLLPYSVLNIACGVLKISRTTFFWTLVLGSFPYNFVTTNVGELLAIVGEAGEEMNQIWDWKMGVKLVGVTMVSVIPVVFKDRMKEFLERVLVRGGMSSTLLGWKESINALFVSNFGVIHLGGFRLSLTFSSPKNWRGEKEGASGSGSGEKRGHKKNRSRSVRGSGSSRKSRNRSVNFIVGRKSARIVSGGSGSGNGAGLETIEMKA